MERITAIVRGRVQGVGYRSFVADCAYATGVHGYVKNLPDRTVEIVAEGSTATLDHFLRLVRAKGDMMIHIDELVVKTGPATGEFHGFRIAW
jgi:acylphosphatase